MSRIEKESKKGLEKQLEKDSRRHREENSQMLPSWAQPGASVSKVERAKKSKKEKKKK